MSAFGIFTSTSMHRYLVENDYRAMAEAQTFHDLLAVALRILKRVPRSLVQLSGPVTTGGKGSIEENLRVLAQATKILQEKGYRVFDISVFHEALLRLEHQTRKGDAYCLEMLEIFFRGIFESGYISKVFFLPDWESSTGARWERECVAKQGIEIIDMTYADTQ